MQSKYLVMVEVGENNNKFYKMVSNGSTFTATWGRIGNTNFQTKDYSIDEWDKILNSKLRKGYVDQTELVAEIVTPSKSGGYLDIAKKGIAEIVKRLQAYAKQAIEDNYTISSSKVTQKMIDEAQVVLDELSASKQVDDFNVYLLRLFRIIPRKMKTVAENMAQSKSDYKKIVEREQDLLDTMKGQVVQQDVVADDSNTVAEQKTILEALGLEFVDIEAEDERIIRENLRSVNNRLHCAWKVINRKTQSRFDSFVKQNNIADKRLLWHGSRNENWWSIINLGLVLRPNATITGKMFGNGIYFAPKAAKSIGYCSLSGSYWANGRDPSGFMSLFNVAYGKPYIVRSFDGGYNGFGYDRLQQKMAGANSLHAMEGAGLRNDEIIVYKEEQVTIKYLVELKN